MKNLHFVLERIQEKSLTRILVLCSLVIAIQLIYIQHGWINNDSVLYFEVARLFTNGEWSQGVALYSWPLYPALIAGIHQVSGLGIQSSAQLLTVILFAATTWSFISLIRLAGGNNFTVFSGTLLLFSSPYIVGDILPMLLRDQGFWAFFLTGLVFFVRFYRDGKLIDALLWQLAAIVAMLFRLEAISYLTLLPLSFAMHADLGVRNRIIRMLQAYAVSLLAVCALVIALSVIPSFSLADLGRLQEIVALFETNYLQITHNIAQKSRLMGELLGDQLDEYGMHGILLTLAIIIPLKTMQAASWWSVALLFMRPKNTALAPLNDTKRLLYWAAGIGLINACLIIMSTFVLTSRYVIALGFVLMLLAAFNMAALFDQAEQRRVRKRIGVALLIILCLSLLANLWPKDDYYNYEQDAVAWTKKHSQADSKIFYSSPRARYYAGASYIGRDDEWVAIINAVNNGSIHHYDYLVINMSRDNSGHEKQLLQVLNGHTLVREFEGFRSKKKVMIFVKSSLL